MKKLKRVLSIFLSFVMIVTAITSTGMIAQASMLPLKEVKAYLALYGYSDEQLSAMSVDSMLNMLTDSDGNPINIPDDATTVWKYIKNETDGIEEYHQYNIGSGETIDLYPGEGIDTYQLEIIVGKNGQLNDNNIRYTVKVYVRDNFEDNLELEIYIQSDDGTRKKAIPFDINYWVSKQNNIDILNFDFSFADSIFDSLSEEGTVWLNVKSELTENPRVKLEIYPTLWIEDVNGGGYLVAIKNPWTTNQILNQNMEIPDTGWQISGQRNTDEMFQIVTYVDGEEYSEKFILMRYWNGYPRNDGKIYTIDKNVKTNVFSNLQADFDSANKITTLTFELQPIYSADKEYYFDYDYVEQLNYGSAKKTGL